MKTSTILLAAAMAVSIHSAQAANGTWTGASNGNWNVDGNWTGASYPGTIAAQIATFNATVTNSTISMNSTPIAANMIFTGSNTGSYTFNAGGGSLNGSITMASDVMNSQTFNLPVLFNHNATYTNNSTNADLILSGGIDAHQVRSSSIVTFTGDGNTSINGVTQTGGGAVTFIKAGAGKVTLSSAAYTGALDVREGVLLLNSVDAIGSGVTILRGGILGLGAGDLIRPFGTGNGNFRFISTSTEPLAGFAAYGADRIVDLVTPVQWGGGISSQLGAGQNLAFGSVDSTNKIDFQTNIGISADLGGVRTIVVNDGVNSNNVDGEISGDISGSGASVIKTGAGTLLLSGSNTYDGLTTVSVGTVLVGNSSGQGSLAGGASVASGAVLGGSGSIAGAVTIDGSLRPGNSIGTLTVQNDVTWNGGNDWVFELGTAATTLADANSGVSIQDQLNITSGGDFLKTGSGWTFDFAGTGAAGWYKLVDWTGTTTFDAGDFAAPFNLTSGLTGTFTVDAGTSALYLNVVPEPGTSVLLGLGGLILLTFRRRAKC